MYAIEKVLKIINSFADFRFDIFLSTNFKDGMNVSQQFNRILLTFRKYIRMLFH